MNSWHLPEKLWILVYVFGRGCSMQVLYLYFLFVSLEELAKIVN